jgi:putative exporter of polyketide antibiotics
MNLIIEPATAFFAAVVNSLAASFGSLALFANDNPDGTLGLLMSGLAGVAAALAVAIMLAVYFRSGYRTGRDMVRHGLAAAAVLGLLAFAAYDMRHAALDYLGISPAKPEVELEAPLPKAAVTRFADSAIAYRVI